LSSSIITTEYGSWPVDEAPYQNFSSRVARRASSRARHRHNPDLERDMLLQHLEGRDVAEERRLVGGHRLDDLAAQRDVRPLEHVDQLRQRIEAARFRDRQQPRLDQVLLAVLEHDPGLVEHEHSHVVEVLRSNRHETLDTPWNGAA
jgi:hypothetical protein